VTVTAVLKSPLQSSVQTTAVYPLKHGMTDIEIASCVAL